MTTRSERGVMVRKPSKDLPAPISTPQPKHPSARRVPLNESMKYCHEFVKELFSKKHAEYAWPFWEPVNPRDYPDYSQKIKRPVDLSLIKVSGRSVLCVCGFSDYMCVYLTFRFLFAVEPRNWQIHYCKWLCQRYAINVLQLFTLQHTWISNHRASS